MSNDAKKRVPLLCAAFATTALSTLFAGCAQSPDTVSCTDASGKEIFHREFNNGATVVIGGGGASIEPAADGGEKLVITNAVRDKKTGETIPMPRGAKDCVFKF